MAFISVFALSFFLLVVGSPSAFGQLQWSRRPSNVTVAAGGNVSLACGARDEHMQSASVSWVKMNQSSLPERFRFSSQSGILELNPVHCVDTGWYTCTVSTPAETAQVHVYLSVVCSGRTPRFIRKLSSQYSFSPNGNSLIHCYANGDPTPDVHWYKRGVRLSPTAPDGGGPFAAGNVVNFQFATRVHSDVYSCVASNVFGTISQSTSVVVREDRAPVWNSWWMITIYVCVLIVALLLALLICVICKEFCFSERNDEFVKPSKDYRINSIGMVSIVSSTQGWSEGVSTRRTTIPSLNETSSPEPSPPRTTEHAVNTSFTTESSPQLKDTAVNRAFGVEVVTTDTYFRPLSWHEYWKRQQESSGGGHVMASALHPVRRHTFNNVARPTHHSEELFEESASPSGRKGRSNIKSDKIRKSEGKSLSGYRRGSTQNRDQSPPLDMTLQLVECDEEDLVTNPSMFDVQSNNTRSPAKFDIQSNSSRTASMFDVQSNNSRAPSMFDVQSKGSQAQEQTEQAFAFLQDYDVTSQGTSEVASLGLSTTNLKSNNSRAPSMSDVQSKGSHVEEQTEQAFAFLEDYDVTSQGTSEVTSLGLSNTNLMSIAEDSEHVTLSS